MAASMGIDAAADWIVAEFDRISKRCGEYLEVKRDPFVADPASAAGSPWPIAQCDLVARPDRYLRDGDHKFFNREGFAAVPLTEWREDYNHQHQNVVQPPPGSSDPVLGDLPEFVDFNYVAKVARLNAAVLATPAGLAGRTGQGLDRHPEAGKWDRVDLGSGSR